MDLRDIWREVLSRIPNLPLIENWLDVLRRAWSVRLVILAAILSGAEVAMPMLQGVLPLPAGTFAALAGVVSTGAILARLLAQKNLPEAKE